MIKKYTYTKFGYFFKTLSKSILKTCVYETTKLLTLSKNKMFIFNYKNIDLQNSNFLLIFGIFFVFLFLDSTLIFCEEVTTTVTKTVSKIPDSYFTKIINLGSAAIYPTGCLVLGSAGILGGIKVAEILYNYPYFLETAVDKTPGIGHVRRFGKKCYAWFMGSEISSPQYTYFYPPILRAVGLDSYTKYFEPQIVIKERVNTITETVIKYNDRLQLKQLQLHLNKIEASIKTLQEYNYYFEKVRNDLIKLECLNDHSRINKRDFELFTTPVETDRGLYYTNFQRLEFQPQIIREAASTSSWTPGSLVRTITNPYQGLVGDRVQLIITAHYSDNQTKQLNLTCFKETFPSLYNLMTERMKGITYMKQHIYLNLRWVPKIGVDTDKLSLDYITKDGFVHQSFNECANQLYSDGLAAAKADLSLIVEEARGFLLTSTSSDVDVFLETQLAQNPDILRTTREFLGVQAYLKAKSEMPLRIQEPAVTTVEEISKREVSEEKVEEDVIPNYTTANLSQFNPQSVAQPAQGLLVLIFLGIMGNAQTFGDVIHFFFLGEQMQTYNQLLAIAAQLPIVELQTMFQINEQAATQIYNFFHPIENSSEISSLSMTTNQPVTDTSIFQWKYLAYAGVLCLGLGIGIYVASNVKNGIDPQAGYEVGNIAKHLYKSKYL